MSVECFPEASWGLTPRWDGYTYWLADEGAPLEVQCMLAINQGRPAGVDASAPRVWMIQNVGTAEAHRGRGCAPRLIRGALAHFQQRLHPEAKAVFLDVLANYDEAIRAYVKAGFQPCTRTTDGEQQDVLVMGKVLDTK
jgi:ribosomal protein S18 acetylase RimI-like enzyme